MGHQYLVFFMISFRWWFRGHCRLLNLWFFEVNFQSWKICWHFGQLGSKGFRFRRKWNRTSFRWIDRCKEIVKLLAKVKKLTLWSHFDNNVKQISLLILKMSFLTLHQIKPINGLMDLSWWLLKGMTIVCRSYVIGHKFINYLWVWG